jgi:uncharacterized protein
MTEPEPRRVTPAEPLDERELDALDALLCSLPSDAAMNVEAMDGYVTALVVGPRLIDRLERAAWLPVVWGGAAFASGKQRKKAEAFVERHLRAVDAVLQADPDAWEPVFSIAEPAGSGEPLVDAGDWCAGFLQAVALDPAAWDGIFDDAALAPLAPLALLGGDETVFDESTRRRLEDPAERDVLSRAVPGAVLALVARN